jgi:hypothetical protein
MKKINYVIIFSIVLAFGFFYTNQENNKSKKPIQKPLTAEEMKTARKKWEASPDGIMYMEWKASPAGKKVVASATKIRTSVNEFSNIEAEIIALTLPPGSRLGFGIMVKIKGDDYILSFGPELNNEFKQLHSLKVTDKIIIKSHSISHAPKYSYPIISGDYVERDNKILYKRFRKKGGC